MKKNKPEWLVSLGLLIIIGIAGKIVAEGVTGAAEHFEGAFRQASFSKHDRHGIPHFRKLA